MEDLEEVVVVVLVEDAVAHLVDVTDSTDTDVDMDLDMDVDMDVDTDLTALDLILVVVVSANQDIMDVARL